MSFRMAAASRPGSISTSCTTRNGFLQYGHQSAERLKTRTRPFGSHQRLQRADLAALILEREHVLHQIFGIRLAEPHALRGPVQRARLCFDDLVERLGVVATQARERFAVNPRR